MRGAGTKSKSNKQYQLKKKKDPIESHLPANSKLVANPKSHKLAKKKSNLDEFLKTKNHGNKSQQLIQTPKSRAIV